MKPLFRIPGMTPLMAVQSQVAFNDNVTKLALVGVVQMVLPPAEAGLWVGAIALLLVTPFVVFAPLSGWLSDRFPKRAVLEGSLWLQLAVMAGLLGALAAGSLPMAVGGFFLLGLQSALMSPARRGIIKELAPDRVGQAVGWMDMLCIAAILGGGLAGGLAVDAAAKAASSPWVGALWVLGGLTSLCVVAVVMIRRVPTNRSAEGAGKRPARDAIFGHVGLLQILRRNPVLWRASLGDAAFYLAGGILTLTLSQAGRLIHPDGVGAAGSAGLWMAIVGGGVAVGSAVAAQMCKRRPVMEMVPVGALMVALSAALSAWQDPSQTGFAVALGLMGFGSGLFLVPLGALLVLKSREEERGRVLAASSMLSSIAGILAVGVHWLISMPFGLGVGGQMMVIGGIFAVTGLASLWMVRRDALRRAALLIAQARYGVTPWGTEEFPRDGGVLLVSNHVSYVDALILSLACPRPIRFLSHEDFFEKPLLGGILRTFRAIPVSPDRAKSAIRTASDCLQEGEVVCIFPEGRLTTNGKLLEIQGGYELIAKRSGCPMVAVWMEGLWGSIHSFEGGRYFTKWPKGLRRQVRVAFSRPMEPLSPDHLTNVFLGLRQSL